MDIEKLNKLSVLLEKGIISEHEFRQEKHQIINANDGSATEQINRIHEKLGLVGRSFMNIFNSIIFLIVFSFFAVAIVFFDYSFYQNVFLVSLAVQILVIILIIVNLYRAGKQLMTSNENDKKETMVFGRSILTFLIILLFIVILTSMPFLIADFITK